MATSQHEDAITKTLRHHDQQLAGLGAEVNAIKSVLGEHSTMLRDIKDAMISIRAHQPATLATNLPLVVNGVMLVGMVFAGLIWVINASNGTELALLKKDVASLMAANWPTVVRK
jgi:hypothetical protein